jgi:predicted RNA-binding Zn-ribbon protein involved in translation (DUF1610 family)
MKAGLFTSYKAEEAGKRVETVDPYGTTRDCSRCGFHVPKNLSERIHECPNCGLIIDRDWNAAVNILNRVGWGTAESTPAEIQPLLQPRTEGASRIHETGSPRALAVGGCHGCATRPSLYAVVTRNRMTRISAAIRSRRRFIKMFDLA